MGELAHDEHAAVCDRGISRRSFMALAAATATASFLAGCASSRKLAPAPSATATPTAFPAFTAMPIEPENANKLVPLGLIQGNWYRTWALTWSPDGSLLATASSAVWLWDGRTGRQRGVLGGPADDVRGVAWSPDGHILASGNFDGTVRVWDGQTGAALATLQASGQVWAIALSPDGTQVAAANGDGTTQVWEVATGKALATLTGHVGQVYCVTWSPDGSMIASGGIDGTVRFWDARTWKALGWLSDLPGNVPAAPGTLNDINGLAYAPDGRLLATAHQDAVVRLWDARTRAKLAELDPHDSGFTWGRDVAWSHDGRLLATSGADDVVRLWDVAHRTQVAQLGGFLGGVWSVAWSPEGSRIAAGGGDGTVRLWGFR